MLINDKDILADEPQKKTQTKVVRRPRIKKEHLREAWGDIFDYYLRGITEKYLRFHGRATRLEFWGFLLVFALLFLVIYALGKYVEMPMLAYYFALASAIPTFAVMVRRLHDINKKAFLYVFLGIVFALSGFFIGFYCLILIALWCFVMVRLLSQETDISEGFHGPANENDETFGEDNIRIIHKFRFLAIMLWIIAIGLTCVNFDDWRIQAEYTGTKNQIMDQIEVAGQQAHLTPAQIEAAQQLMTQTLKSWTGKTVQEKDIADAINQALKAVKGPEAQ